ncbi:MAG: primase-helicase family protein [Maricaulaceae bacterium]
MKSRNEKAFRNEHRSSIPNAPVAFTSSKYSLMLEGRDYIPGQPRLYRKNDDVYLNTWMGPNIQAIEGDCETILSHFKFMFPDDEVLKHWLDCFACLIQFPSEKIKHCLLLIGEQGVGKSYFKYLLNLILGPKNIALIDSGEWSKNFNAHILDVQAGVIEELMAGRQLESYNELKQYISENIVMANRKNVPQYSARTPYLMLALSNHRKPIILEPSDRRFFVYHSPAKKQRPDYYKRLFNQTETEVSAFLHFLQQRDLTNFSPDAPPPITASKRELIELSENPLHSILKALRDELEGCFRKDVVTLQEVTNTLIGSGRYHSGRITPQKLSAALLDLGSIKLGVRRIGVEQKKLSLWAIRAGEKWEVADKETLTKEYRKGGKGL